MRIVITADTYPPDVNGAANFARQLAVGMADRGHEVHILAPSPKGASYEETVDGVREHRMRSHEYPLFKGFHICFPWQTKPEVAQVMQQIQPDVIHTQAHFVVGRYAVKWAINNGVPLVATNHFMPENLADHLPVPLPGFLKRFAADRAWRDLGNVFRSADILTAPTALAVDLMRRRALLGGGQPVSCGIDSEKYAAAAAAVTEPNQIPTILAVGRLEQEKRVDEIIRAIAKVPTEVPVRLEVVGQGTKLAEWRELAEKLQVSDRVEFRGYIPDDELVAAFGACDIFCQPGIAELQSIVTLEAMSAAKPVLLANAVALPHLCRQGENGYLFEPGNVDELAGYITELASDPQRREQMGQVSAEMVQEHALGATLDTFTALYEEAISRHQI